MAQGVDRGGTSTTGQFEPHRGVPPKRQHPGGSTSSSARVSDPLAAGLCLTYRECMQRKVGVVLLWCALAAYGSGCGSRGGPRAPEDVGVDAHVDASTETQEDAGTDAGDTRREPCGETTCSPSEHCCPLCPGESACVPNAYAGCPVADDFDCRARDCSAGADLSAVDVGDCDTILGYWWDGTECRSLSGCACTSAGCEELFATNVACRAALSGCVTCGTVDHVQCGEGEYCRKRGTFSPCGPIIADQHGTCVPIPESCDPMSEPVCGCDGTTYDNPCLVRAAAELIDHRGACEP